MKLFKKKHKEETNERHYSEEYVLKLRDECKDYREKCKEYKDQCTKYCLAINKLKSNAKIPECLFDDIDVDNTHRVYLLYSKDGETYEIIKDITAVKDNYEQSILSVTPMISDNYKGDGYYAVATRDTSRSSLSDDVLGACLQFAYFRNGYKSETLNMSKIELMLGRKRVFTIPGRYDSFKDIYSHDIFLYEYLNN